MGQKSPEAPTRVGGAPYPLGSPPTSGPPRRPPCLVPDAKNPYKYRNPRKETKIGSSAPQASLATENQSSLVPASCRRGESLSGGHLHHPGALHDKEGLVHPRG